MRIDERRSHVRLAIFPAIGQRLRLTLQDENQISGYVTAVSRNAKSVNPFAASDWKFSIAIPGQGYIHLPMSQVTADPANKAKTLIERDSFESHNDTAARYNAFKEGLREKRVIATGNLLAAFDYQKGQIAHFTMGDGRIAIAG